MAQKPNPTLSREELTRLCGDVPEWMIIALLETGATARDVEAALLWSQGVSDIAGDERVPLTGAAAAVYDILTTDQDEEGDRC
ncbi:MAG: hypothetical protein AB7U38_03330 [Hyphomicrobiales bacterium]